MTLHVNGPILQNHSLNQWNSEIPLDKNPDYVVYFNDFLMAQDYAAADWVVTTTEAGGGDASEALVANETGGALILTNDAADNDLDALQATEETWILAAGKQLWFEAKCKVSDADQVDMFIGLAVTDTTVLDASRVGFELVDGSASILCRNKLSSESSTASGQSAADDTYVKLGFHWDGKNAIRYYVNRQLVATHASNIPTAKLCTSMHIQNGEAVAKSMSIDYIHVVMER